LLQKAEDGLSIDLNLVPGGTIDKEIYVVNAQEKKIRWKDYGHIKHFKLLKIIQ